MAVDQQTLQDLEFNEVREWLLEFAEQPTARKRICELAPYNSFDRVELELKKTKEFHSIREEGEPLPAIDFEEIDKEIGLLPVENASISLEGFYKIRTASDLTNRILYFFDKREKEYPLLSAQLEHVYYTKDIIELIDKVFDRNGKVRDDASPALASIRQSIKQLRTKINRNFDREVKKLQRDNILGETTETFLNERRVLTVLSNYKRKVSGAVVGSSNSGNYTYIEPQVNIPLNNELEMLLDDERKEVFRILQDLRRSLNNYSPLITAYQDLLTELEFISAKARFAQRMNADLPSYSKEQEIELIEAFHPLLWRNNNAQKKKTYSQSLSMDKFSRVVVISGPNAGGKSITLKSVGLLQIMLQSGLLIPVNPNSKLSFFGTILSDIGDNQSIANELSTYSYRLKRMKVFLEKANRNTLFLIDEFGTGSDPDLGGALAEAIFEALYSKKAFGLITTHYANIKLKADKLKNAVNGSMLFNTETLEPLYRFTLGQPGSSFTFEVAKINGIPDELIEAAKSKISQDKIKMDKLLSELQREKNYLSKLNQEHIEAQEIAEDARIHFEESKATYEDKLKRLKESSTSNEKLLQLGKKMASYIKDYKASSRKKSINEPLFADIRKFIAMEKSKILEEDRLKKEKAKQKPVNKKKRIKPQSDQYQRAKIKVGSNVKLIATKQSGVVEEISGENVIVTFGFARMKVKRDKLMWLKD
jgi:DNA mismatch repair protein MutS2